MIIKYPVTDRYISQPFGRDTSNDPIYKEFYSIFDNKHCGVDFPVSVGTDIFASYTGIVVRAENHLGMGKVVGIRNGNIVALYAHLSKVIVELGQIINSGDLVALSGATGQACPVPHLHFELRDLTKPSLKEMVFEPEFEKSVETHKETFEYIVNNKNSQKTLNFLSILYFGTERYWQKIKSINSFNCDSSSHLEDGSVVIIPNFS